MLWYSLEAPQRVPQHSEYHNMFSWRYKNNISTFWLKKKCALTGAMKVSRYIYFLQYFFEN